MLVQDRMSTPAVTITPETPFQEALELMRQHHFRRLPVVNKQGQLVGIVSERDMLHASPSPASTLSVWELNYLLWKLQTKDLMSEQVVSVKADTPIEEAARIMVERKIGGLPVINNAEEVVGVITETDIFKAFTELLGGEEHALRLQLRVKDGKGVLAGVAKAIADLGGNILSMGTWREPATDGGADKYMLLIKVVDVDRKGLEATVAAHGDEILDARIV